MESGEVIRLGKRYAHILRAGKVVRGVIQIKRAGFGFVKTDEGEIFIPAWATGDALSGDEVEVLIFPDRKGELPEGKVLRVIKHGLVYVGGTYVGRGMVITDDPRLGTVRVKLKKGQKIKRGTRVILRRKDGRWEIYEVNLDDYRLIELKYSLPAKFPRRVLKEVENLRMEKDKGRVDLREEFTITIDPRTAKDYDDAIYVDDDAIYVERYEKGWILKVHIADVSYWVRKGSALDKEALKRGTSVYLIYKLSDDLASLLPGKPKYTFTVEVKITRDGRVLTRTAKFYRSVIKSWARFTYEDAERVLNGEEPSDPSWYPRKRGCGATR